MAGKRLDLEHEEQKALFQWARSVESQIPELRLMHSTQTGAKRSPGTARRAKAEGMKAGVPDIFLDVKAGPYSGLRIELKRPEIKSLGIKAGEASPEQKKWLDHYTREGFMAVVCYGWDHARKVILEYLAIRHGVSA
jgi:hypothetical protein